MVEFQCESAVMKHGNAQTIDRLYTLGSCIFRVDLSPLHRLFQIIHLNIQKPTLKHSNPTEISHHSRCSQHFKAHKMTGNVLIALIASCLSITTIIACESPAEVGDSVSRDQRVSRPLIDPECPERHSAFLLWIDQRKEIQLGQELRQEIYQYLPEYDAIPILFQMFTSPELNKEFLGFESYDALHQRFPTSAKKVRYLKSLWMRRALDIKFDEDASFTKIVFDENDLYIKEITIRRFHQECRPRTFNWDAVAQLKHLQIFSVSKLNIDVSMNDIQRLSSSLKSLDITGSHWTTPDGLVDVSFLPSGLENFKARDCEGMNGVLNYKAPNSNLKSMDTGSVLILSIWDEGKLVNLGYDLGRDVE